MPNEFKLGSRLTSIKYPNQSTIIARPTINNNQSEYGLNSAKRTSLMLINESNLLYDPPYIAPNWSPRHTDQNEETSDLKINNNWYHTQTERVKVADLNNDNDAQSNDLMTMPLGQELDFDEPLSIHSRRKSMRSRGANSSVMRSSGNASRAL